MKSIRQKREIRSKGLVNPQIAPSIRAPIPPQPRGSWGAQHRGPAVPLQITRYSCNDE